MGGGGGSFLWSGEYSLEWSEMGKGVIPERKSPLLFLSIPFVKVGLQKFLHGKGA